MFQILRNFFDFCSAEDRKRFYVSIVFSFLQAVFEALIQRSVAKLVQGKTLIVIAHRLSTVKNADCIYVINDGSIVESGTHDELLKNGALYSAMWTAHLSAKDGEDDV